ARHLSKSVFISNPVAPKGYRGPYQSSDFSTLACNGCETNRTSARPPRALLKSRSWTSDCVSNIVLNIESGCLCHANHVWCERRFMSRRITHLKITNIQKINKSMGQAGFTYLSILIPFLTLCCF
uniref:Uncharacterized protein n=1 Tax=Oryzias latipes TaxID=8090 RepID=A0A3P9HIN6_ORYLA